MGDTQVRRRVASPFDKGVDLGLIIRCSPFMVDDKDPLVLSNYIFELLEVNPGVARFQIQLYLEDVEEVVEAVTAHAKKGAGAKTTCYVGQEEEENVEEEAEEVEEVGGGTGRNKPHHPLVISVQKIRITPSKGKGKADDLLHTFHCTPPPLQTTPPYNPPPTGETVTSMFF